MSDKFYAVQFRSMHTAIHSVAIFSLEEAAVELFYKLNDTEEMPVLDFPYGDVFVDMYEIDHRKPPITFGDPDDADSVPLEYVNFPEGNIPDVYGY